MATAAARERRSERDARAALRERLEARREEIEAVALTRVKAISDPSEIADPAYAEGLRAAVAAAVAYGIETTGREGSEAPIPVALLAQARMAARVGIPLDTVLRRYFAGYSLLGYFILEEASHAGLTDGTELKRLLGTHAGLFDRLLAAVGEEHGRESHSLRTSQGRRQRETVERLLAGEMIDMSDVPYDFAAWHLGLIGEGSGVIDVANEIASALDMSLLSVERQATDSSWVWLGDRSHPNPTKVLELARLASEIEAPLAIGEPGRGLTGWRLTHRQATVTLEIARRDESKVLRYADVALIASAAKDELLAESLRSIYIAPLTSERDEGLALRSTLRAYLAAGGNRASTASWLGVTPRTVRNRLLRYERLVGRPVHAARPDLDVALRLQDLS